MNGTENEHSARPGGDDRAEEEAWKKLRRLGNVLTRSRGDPTLVHDLVPSTRLFRHNGRTLSETGMAPPELNARSGPDAPRFSIEPREPRAFTTLEMIHSQPLPAGGCPDHATLRARESGGYNEAPWTLDGQNLRVIWDPDRGWVLYHDVDRLGIESLEAPITIKDLAIFTESTQRGRLDAPRVDLNALRRDVLMESNRRRRELLEGCEAKSSFLARPLE